jgi:hypothetical protein
MTDMSGSNERFIFELWDLRGVSSVVYFKGFGPDGQIQVTPHRDDAMEHTQEEMQETLTRLRAARPHHYHIKSVSSAREHKQ